MVSGGVVQMLSESAWTRQKDACTIRMGEIVLQNHSRYYNNNTHTFRSIPT
jgi:hypothetical protein